MSPVRVAGSEPLAVGSLDKRAMGRPVFNFRGCSQFDTIADAQLKQAAEQAEREGSERPLVMQQLRAKIQLERLKSGKRELVVQFDEPKQYELTEEEKEKLERRKKRNRDAAKKSRNKKRSQHSQLEKKNKKLKSERERLKEQVKKLRQLTNSFQTAITHTRRCLSIPLSTPLLKPSLPKQGSKKIVVWGQAPPSAKVPQQFFLSHIADTDVPSPFALSTPDASPDAVAPMLGQYVTNFDGMSDVPFIPSPPSSSSSPPAYEAGVSDFESPQSFMELLQDFDAPKNIYLPPDGQSFDLKQGSFSVDTPFNSGRSSTETIGSPSSQHSPGGIFGAALGLNRGP